MKKYEIERDVSVHDKNIRNQFLIRKTDTLKGKNS